MIEEFSDFKKDVQYLPIFVFNNDYINDEIDELFQEDSHSNDILGESDLQPVMDQLAELNDRMTM
jgi:hypothetical protein